MIENENNINSVDLDYLKIKTKPMAEINSNILYHIGLLLNNNFINIIDFYKKNISKNCDTSDFILYYNSYIEVQKTTIKNDTNINIKNYIEEIIKQYINYMDTYFN
jgi:hypothetical protein